METKENTSGPDSWVAFHLYYHEDLERALHRLVAPLARDLIAERRAADRFFFVRYFLGGPHLRIRFRCLPGQAETVEKVFRDSAEEFLRACPSQKSIDPDDVARANEGILQSDAFEEDAGVYADNSFRLVPFRPEVERYGGETLLPSSLDFFAVSSLVALDLLRGYEGRSRTQFLSGAARLLFAQAVGMAVSLGHLKGLVDYADEERWAPIAKKADAVYERDPGTFRVLIQSVSGRLAQAATGSDGGQLPRLEVLHAAARLLLSEVRSTDPITRGKILGSQMHMTANRIGLRLADEVYLGHLLRRAFEDDVAEDSARHAEALASEPRVPQLQGCATLADFAERSLAVWLPAP